MAKRVPVQTLEREGDKELVRLPPLVLASTKASGGWREASSEAFQRLARYLFGDNQQARRMPMTAPVLSHPVSQGWEMTFVLSWSGQAPPKTNDPDVELSSQGPGVVARLRFSGWGTPERFQEVQKDLERWMQTHGWTPTRPAVWAQYNPPWTAPWFRRNEVWLPVDVPAEGARWVIVQDASCRLAGWVRSAIPRCQLPLMEVSEQFPQVQQRLQQRSEAMRQAHLLLLDPVSGAMLRDGQVVEEILQFLVQPSLAERVAKYLPTRLMTWWLKV